MSDLLQSNINRLEKKWQEVKYKAGLDWNGSSPVTRNRNILLSWPAAGGPGGPGGGSKTNVLPVCSLSPPARGSQS